MRALEIIPELYKNEFLSLLIIPCHVITRITFCATHLSPMLFAKSHYPMVKSSSQFNTNRHPEGESKLISQTTFYQTLKNINVLLQT